MCQRKKDQRGRGIWVREEGLGSIGEKDQSEGQSRHITLHLLMATKKTKTKKTCSDNKIIGLLGLGEWGLVVCLVIIHVMVMKTNNR